MVPQGRTNCTNCGSPISKSSDDLYEQADRKEKYESLKKKGFMQTKAGVMLLGSLEVIIGFFAAIYVVVEFSASIPDGAILAGLVVGVWAVVLPIIGLILICIGQNKLGGGILIAGSVICIPIGFVGVMAGVNAFKLDN